MNTQTILTRAVEIVMFLFAAFGHFLHNAAPPSEGGVGFAVGFASFLSLTVLLFVSALSKSRNRVRHRKRWLMAAAVFLLITLGAAPLYQMTYNRHTFRYPENSTQVYVRGTELTSEAQQHLQANPGISVQTLVADFGGLPERTAVWTAAARERAELVLTVTYLVLVLSLATTIFSLTEGVLSAKETQ